MLRIVYPFWRNEQRPIMNATTQMRASSHRSLSKPPQPRAHRTTSATQHEYRLEFFCSEDIDILAARFSSRFMLAKEIARARPQPTARMHPSGGRLWR